MYMYVNVYIYIILYARDVFLPAFSSADLLEKAMELEYV